MNEIETLFIEWLGLGDENIHALAAWAEADDAVQTAQYLAFLARELQDFVKEVDLAKVAWQLRTI